MNERKIPTSLAERIAWAIWTIRNDDQLDKDISYLNLGKKLNIDKDTVAKYEKGAEWVKSDAITNIKKIYNFSIMWLHEGYGEPFPGARHKYPEVCGPEEVSYDSPGMRDQAAHYRLPSALLTSEYPTKKSTLTLQWGRHI